jgi:hypothetical protein
MLILTNKSIKMEIFGGIPMGAGDSHALSWFRSGDLSRHQRYLNVAKSDSLLEKPNG